MSRSVFDPGLQLERTMLAWRRTCLAFALVSVVAMRFNAEAAGIVAVVGGLAGAGLAAAAYAAAAARYRSADDSLHDGGTLEYGAWPMALATATALLVGAGCTAYVVTGALGA